MDWQPVIMAIAGLILALTPVAVAYVNIKVNQLQSQVQSQGTALRSVDDSQQRQISSLKQQVTGPLPPLPGKRLL